MAELEVYHVINETPMTDTISRGFVCKERTDDMAITFNAMWHMKIFLLARW